MARYAPLGEYLRIRSALQVGLSFDAVEDIIEGDLPPSARSDPAWWASDETHAHARAWLEVGWKVGEVDIAGERVVFVRVPAREGPFAYSSATSVPLTAAVNEESDEFRGAMTLWRLFEETYGVRHTGLPVNPVLMQGQMFHGFVLAVAQGIWPITPTEESQYYQRLARDFLEAGGRQLELTNQCIAAMIADLETEVALAERFGADIATVWESASRRFASVEEREYAVRRAIYLKEIGKKEEELDALDEALIDAALSYEPSWWDRVRAWWQEHSQWWWLLLPAYILLRHILPAVLKGTAH